MDQAGKNLPSQALFALALPEILLNIFSNFIYTDFALPKTALVCKAWRGPSNTYLYGIIALEWRFSNSRRLKLLDTFHLNPSLRSLVKSCAILGFGNDDMKEEVWNDVLTGAELRNLWLGLGYTEDDIDDDEDGSVVEQTEYLWMPMVLTALTVHTDSPWIGGEGSVTSLESLVDMLASFDNLKELALTSIVPISPNEATANLVAKTMQIANRLKSLSMTDVDGWFGEHLLINASRTIDLLLEGDSLDLHILSHIPVQHLVLNVMMREETWGEGLGINFGASLTHLHLHLMNSTLPSFFLQPTQPQLLNLTYLRIDLFSYEEIPLKFYQTLFSLAPNLITFYFICGPHTPESDNFPPLSKFVEALPHTIQTIEIHTAGLSTAVLSHARLLEILVATRGHNDLKLMRLEGSNEGAVGGEVIEELVEDAKRREFKLELTHLDLVLEMGGEEEERA